PARYTPHCRRTFHQTSSFEGEYPFHSISELVFSSHPTLPGGSFFYSIVCLRLSKTNDSIDQPGNPTSSCFRQTKKESTPIGLNPQRIRISLEHSFRSHHTRRISCYCHLCRLAHKSMRSADRHRCPGHPHQC